MPAGPEAASPPGPLLQKNPAVITVRGGTNIAMVISATTASTEQEAGEGDARTLRDRHRDQPPISHDGAPFRPHLFQLRKIPACGS